MTIRSDLTLVRIAAIGVLVAGLGLAGCGRKGGLDPPPAAAAAGEPTAAAEPSQAKPDPALGRDGKPVAPATGPKKPFFLDWLVE